MPSAKRCGASLLPTPEQAASLQVHAVLAVLAGALRELSGRRVNKWYGAFGALGGTLGRLCALDAGGLTRADVAALACFGLMCLWVVTAPWGVPG